jgi:STAS-like domain of unknown function (DUF4325)
MNIDLKSYGPVISDKAVGDSIYSIIKQELNKNSKVTIDFKDVISMATFNAKQIFGKLYLELGASAFASKLELKNVNNDLRLIIRMGIESAIEDL